MQAPYDVLGEETSTREDVHGPAPLVHVRPRRPYLGDFAPKWKKLQVTNSPVVEVAILVA